MATMWRKLENIMATERTQAQKIAYDMILFIVSIQNRQIYFRQIGEQWLPWLGGAENEE